jgi:hypothetical protein
VTTGVFTLPRSAECSICNGGSCLNAASSTAGRPAAGICQQHARGDAQETPAATTPVLSSRRPSDSRELPRFDTIASLLLLPGDGSSMTPPPPPPRAAVTGGRPPEASSPLQLPLLPQSAAAALLLPLLPAPMLLPASPFAGYSAEFSEQPSSDDDKDE